MWIELLSVKYWLSFQVDGQLGIRVGTRPSDDLPSHKDREDTPLERLLVRQYLPDCPNQPSPLSLVFLSLSLFVRFSIHFLKLRFHVQEGLVVVAVGNLPSKLLNCCLDQLPSPESDNYTITHYPVTNSHIIAQ